MSSRETAVHSFVVRVWLEEDAEAEQGITWHGHVTHIPGGEDRYFRDLNDLTNFILSYLGSVGRGRRDSLYRRLKRWWDNFRRAG